MRVNFYDLVLSEDDRAVLEKKKAVNFATGKMNHPDEVVTMMRDLLHMDKMAEEHCFMIALNNTCKMIGIFFLSKGTVNYSVISPRELFIRTLLVGAVQFILCHNHPSGECSPSKTDIEVTKSLKDAGELLGIPLTDHIIVGGDTYYSFKEYEML